MSGKKRHTKKTAKRSKKEIIVKGYKSVNVNMSSWHDPNYKFVVGKEHKPTKTPKKGDTEPCGIGMHFCRKQKDAASYARHEDYILLEVQANKSDILGEDETKTRAAKLTVNKILKRVELYGAKWKAAEKEAKEVAKKVLIPNKLLTPQKLSGLIQAWARACFYKKSKTHITDNFYEALALYELVDSVCTDEYCDLVFSVREFPADHHCILAECIDDLLYSYLGSFEGEGDPAQKAEFAPLFEMLKLGALPIGFVNNTLLIYAPKTDPQKIKRAL
jgi:hypothetical protein